MSSQIARSTSASPSSVLSSLEKTKEMLVRQAAGIAGHLENAEGKLHSNFSISNLVHDKRSVTRHMQKETERTVSQEDVDKISLDCQDSNKLAAEFQKFHTLMMEMGEEFSIIWESH